MSNFQNKTKCVLKLVFAGKEGREGTSPWTKDSDMESESSSIEGYYRLNGTMKIPKFYLKRGCQYYYALRNGEYNVREYIHTTTSYHTVDRLLKFEDPSDEIWIYNDVIHPGKLEWSRQKEHNNHKDTRREDCERAMLAMLPNWSGFVVNGEENKANEALQTFRRVVQGITETKLMKNGKISIKPVKNIRKANIITKCLEDKLNYFDERKELAHSKHDIISSLAITVICNEYNIFDNKEDWRRILARTLFHSCEIRNDIDQHFGKISDDARAAIVKLCNDMIKRKETEWVFTLPLLHCVTYSSKSTSTLPSISQLSDLHWWGLSGLDVQMYIEKNYNDTIMTHFDEIAQAFAMDDSLPRSIAYLENLRGTSFSKLVNDDRFPTHLVYVKINNDIKQNNDTHKERKMEPSYKFDVRIKNILGILKRRNMDCFLSANLTEHKDDIQIAHAMSIQLIHYVVDTRSLSKTDILSLVDAASTNCDLIVCLRKYQHECFQPELEDIGNCVDMIGKYFDSTESESPTNTSARWQSVLNDWNRLVEIKFEVKEIHDRVIEAFYKMIQNLPVRDMFDMFFSCDQSKRGPLQSKIASRAIEIYKDNKEIVIEMFPSSEESSMTHGQFFSCALELDVPVVGRIPDNKLVKHLLTSTVLLHYIQHSDEIPTLYESTQKIVQDVKKVIKNHHEECLDGQIKINILRLITQHKSEWSKLVHWSVSGEEFVDPDQYLSIRKRELEAVDNFRKSLNEFDTFTRRINFTGNTSCLSSIRNALTGDCLENSSIKEIVSVQTVSADIDSSEAAAPLSFSVSSPLFNPSRIYANDITPQVVEILETTGSATGFPHVFISIWDIISIDYPSNILLDEFADLYLGDIKNALKKLRNQLKSSEIVLGDVCNYFQAIKNDANKILSQLSALLSNEISDEKLKIIQHKITYCFKILDVRTAAKTVRKCQQELALRGEFPGLKEMCAEKNDLDQMELSFLTDDVIASIDKLMKVDSKKCEGLQEFLSNGEVIHWSKRVTQGSIAQLRQFISLIYQWVDKHEIPKVRTYQSAVEGCVPLMNVPVDADIHQLLQSCEELWESIKLNHTLLQNLKDSNANRKWLQDLWETHVKPSEQCKRVIKSINERGVYYIKQLETPSNQISDYIELQIPAEVDETYTSKSNTNTEVVAGNDVKLTLREIMDYRDRVALMMADQDKDNTDFEWFIQVLDELMSLVSSIIILQDDGSDIFQTFEAAIIHENGVNKFVIQMAGEKFKGTGATDAVLAEMNEFLKSCIKEWKMRLKCVRDSFYNLNHFTSKQLCFLRKELNNILEPKDVIDVPGKRIISENATESKIPQENTNKSADVHALSSMLTHINDTIDDDILWKIVNGCMNLVKERPELLSQGGIYQTQDVRQLTIEDEKERHEFSQFIETMMELDEVDERIAKAAFQASEGDIERGHAWCLTCNETQLQEMLTEFCKSKFADIDDLNTGSPLQDATSDISSEKVYTSLLVKSLSAFWSKNINTHQGQVSLEFLGMVLAELCSEAVTLEGYDVFHNIIPGIPNSCSVTENDVLNTLLSLYTTNGKVYFPNRDQILLCNEKTTKEEVTLFLRRCIRSQVKKRLYSLVYADRLPFDIADDAISELRSLCTESKDYKLVIISAEEYGSSAMSIAFHKYRIEPPTIELDVLRKNVNEFLHSMDSESVGQVIDPDRRCLRIVTSSSPGLGKTLAIHRLLENYCLKRNYELSDVYLKIPINTTFIDLNSISSSLVKHVKNHGYQATPMIYHFDISASVETGIEEFIFMISILREIQCQNVHIWRRRQSDLCLFETTQRNIQDSTVQDILFSSILPRSFCISPQDNVDGQVIEGGPNIGFDDKTFHSEPIQRVYHHLKIYNTKKEELKHYEFNLSKTRVGDKKDCMEVLIKHCGVENPSWTHINIFVKFMNHTLSNWQTSPFCGLAASSDLPGLRLFVVTFMAIQAKNYASRGMQLSDESFQAGQEQDKDLQCFQLKQKWESSAHPYIYFNQDGASITFHGMVIYLDGYLRNSTDNKLIPGLQMDFYLRHGLILNGVDVLQDFDYLSRCKKIEHIYTVMGMEVKSDPDPTYELTTDNVSKLLDILMNFRCDIPVVIMGDTGTGKTRMVKFLCKMMAGRSDQSNFHMVKIHGGTTNVDIEKKVWKASQSAKHNEHKINVLFFDEANSCEAVGLVGEILIDRTVRGKPIDTPNLKFVAACNPYRKHGDAAIKQLETAGLGFTVDSANVQEKLGHVPLRHLVYRVHPLPKSMMPFIWDFGQLNAETEKKYIRSLVNNNEYIRHLNKVTKQLICNVLAMSQMYMKQQEEECKFASLRDIKRVIEVFVWFHRKYDLIKNGMDIKEAQHVWQHSMEPESQVHETVDLQSESGDSLYANCGSIDENTLISGKVRVAESSGGIISTEEIKKTRRCLILAIGVCYHASLKNRKKYRNYISWSFEEQFKLPHGPDSIHSDIMWCQELFMDDAKVTDHIAKNKNLTENVFMIAICLELRIPLFIIGKPGSSKSLARTIIDNTMQSPSSDSKIFQHLKKIQMFVCQCSQHSRPEDIIETFDHASTYQKDLNLDEHIGVVLLDEVGLAEDSPKMPLKTLHPLLETGSIYDEVTKEEPYKKVGFIGLSNWPLDPAKMNRGITVVTDVPDTNELVKSARSICGSLKLVDGLLEPISKAYKKIFDKCLEIREYFGLRDFYSLIKMVHTFCLQQDEVPSWNVLKHFVLRNFDGHDQINPEETFKEYCEKHCSKNRSDESAIHCTVMGLVKSNLDSDGSTGENRYLLLMTKNNAAYKIIRCNKINGTPLLNERKILVIYGSKFKADQEYSQICKNVMRLKYAMENGETVVLIKAENVYESLYDVMNQYYLKSGDYCYVRLGLGTHRFSCNVSKEFRLIVVAEKDTALKKYPIPLMNRLEKHYLAMESVLSNKQNIQVEHHKQWLNNYVESGQPVSRFTRLHSKPSSFAVSEVVVGYNEDTVATLVYDVDENTHSDNENTDVDAHNNSKIIQVKTTIIHCTTPDSVIRYVTAASSDDYKWAIDEYFRDMRHASLSHCIDTTFTGVSLPHGLLYLVTTHGKLLSDTSSFKTASEVYMVTLQQFKSEQHFRNVLRDFYGRTCDRDTLLVIQSVAGQKFNDMISFAMYLIEDERNKIKSSVNHHVAFVVQLPRTSGNQFQGFWISPWYSIHIDDVNTPSAVYDVQSVRRRPMSDVIRDSLLCNTTAILRMSIHNSTKRLEDHWKDDTTGGQPYATRRIKILKKILFGSMQPGQRTYATVFKKRIYPLLQTRDGGLDDNGRRWCEQIARDHGRLRDSGSFRSALENRLIEVVAPIQAELLSILDKNGGLDFIGDYPPESWIHKFAMDIFEDNRIIIFNYNNFLTAERRFRDTVLVMHDCSSNTMMWKLPFSWLIFKQLETSLSAVETLTDDAIERSYQLWKTVDSSPLGSIIQRAFDNGCEQELFRFYLNDFVHLVYKGRSPDEVEMACQCISSAIEEMRNDHTEMNVTLAHIHIAYHRIKERLHCMAQLIKLFPEMLPTISKRNMEDEMIADILTFQYAVNTLKPTSKEQLKNDDYLRNWLCILVPEVAKINDQLRVLQHLFGTQSMRLYNQCRQSWINITMVRMFLDNVSQEFNTLKKDIEYVMIYYNAIENDTITKWDHLKRVEGLLNTCNKNAVKEILG
ncbi:E3 ubiquitin-protein ligase rnf213-alpha-like [Saccoglossus kowalevskii]